MFPRVSTSSREKIRQVSISSLTNRGDGVFVGLRSIATARAGLVELLSLLRGNAVRERFDRSACLDEIASFWTFARSCSLYYPCYD